MTAMYESVAKIGKENVEAVMFDYKAPHNSCELLFGRGHCIRLGVRFQTVELGAMGGLQKENWVVPLRNAEFLIRASRIALEVGAGCVVIGCNKDDADYPFPDCSAKFISDMNSVVRSSGYEVKIVAPYINLRKRQIIAIARKHGVPLHELWTCYQPTNGAQCGVCPACKKMEEACGL